jgi:translation initiation factor 1 (eIF-1/SUI1)
VAKKCSKKFAVSCSVTEVGTVQLQGDNFDNMRDFLLSEYKQQLKKKYILDKEEFNVRQADEIAKRKEAKKR